MAVAVPQHVLNSVLGEGATEEKGENARMSSFVGAIAISDMVKSTLGPKGMDKILQSMGRGQHAMVTNDGATILKSVYVDNPAAKVLVDLSKVQDDEVGDGTTSVAVLAGELLREAEQLIEQKIHPMIIIDGFRKACEVAVATLQGRAFDNAADPVALREDLMSIARTTLSSKILTHDKDYFAKIAVDSVMCLKGRTNLEPIHIIKKSGGTLRDSFLAEGFILDKKMGVGQKKRMEDAKVLVANTPMDTDKIKMYGARVKTDSMTKVAEIEAAERNKMKVKCEQIIAQGINVFINRQLIYNYPEQIFTDAGVTSIEHAGKRTGLGVPAMASQPYETSMFPETRTDFEGVERLALVLGAEIASTFENPSSIRLGACKLIEEIMIGEDKLIHFSGVALGEACTIVLRGANSHLLDEAERSMHDALCVLSQTVANKGVIYGGGNPEISMARGIDEIAAKTPGKASLAMEAFGRALRKIPTIICDNAGMDAAGVITELRAAVAQDVNSKQGVDVMTGGIGDMSERKVFESLKVKRQVVLSATEACEMILRVDDIIKCAPRERDGM